MKQYVGISRDHSGSMRGLERSALNDYNRTIEDVKKNAGNDIDTIVSVVECGVGHPATVHRVVTNSSVYALKPLDTYKCDGNSTPLRDSVGALIEIFQSVPDALDPNVSFLVMVITDGQENSSRKYTDATISSLIKNLQATDRWTFVFQVPRGGRREVKEHFGVPDGNIVEWEQTERGFSEVGATRSLGLSTYYESRRKGITGSATFFSDLSNVKSKDLKRKLTNIASKVQIFTVDKLYDHARGASIQMFMEAKTKSPYAPGTAFYELTKKEAKILPNRQVLIHDRKTKAVYAGPEARQILGLPDNQEAKLQPGDHSIYDVFIESHSVNRVLNIGSKVVYWPQNRF